MPGRRARCQHQTKLTPHPLLLPRHTGLWRTMPRLLSFGALTSLVPEPGPRRVLAVGTLVNAFGFGLVFTSMTLYFTRVLHLSNGLVGLGLTIAGLIGMFGGVPIGHLADRLGPRE